MVFVVGPEQKVDSSLLMEWYHKVLDGVAKIVKKLKKQRKPCSNMILNSPDVIDSLSKLQDKFVFVPTDKASNNIAIVCKKFYIEQSMRELNISQQITRTMVRVRMS